MKVNFYNDQNITTIMQSDDMQYTHSKKQCTFISTYYNNKHEGKKFFITYIMTL